MVASMLVALAMATTGQPKIDPGLLIGTWDADPKGPGKVATIIFGRDGTFRSIPRDTNNSEFPGTYQVSGAKITINPHEFEVTIKQLNENSLTLEGLSLEGSDPIEFKRRGAGTARGGMLRGMTRSGGFQLGVMPGAAAVPGKWVVVKSDTGDFHVEMPGPPNGRESGGFGGFNERSMSYQNRTMELVVTSIQMPMEVPQDQVGKFLGVLRNRALERYGKDAKVVSEKPVRVDGLEGQEFVMSLDRMGTGAINVSGRVFAKGKTAYSLLALPMAKGGTLGADAQKFLGSFALGEPSGRTAGPAPRPLAKRATRGAMPSAPRTWGTEVDPDHDVKIRKSVASLTMEIPATGHLLAPERNLMNAPRIVAPVEGDFSVSVQVSGAFRPVPKSTVKGLSSRQSGGLVLWKDDKNYVVLQRRASLDDGKTLHQAVLEELVGGGKGATHRQPIAEGATFLRLERNGSQISAAISEDGKDWKPFKPVDAKWLDAEVKVGIVAVNTSPTVHAPRFDAYALKEK